MTNPERRSTISTGDRVAELTPDSLLRHGSSARRPMAGLSRLRYSRQCYLTLVLNTEVFSIA